MYATFNMGVGFVAIVPAGSEQETMALAQQHGHEAMVIGEVIEGDRLDLAG